MSQPRLLGQKPTAAVENTGVEGFTIADQATSRKPSNSLEGAVVTTDFDLMFPVLSAALANIEALTDYDDVRLKLKFADDLVLSQGTRSFFKENMGRVIDAVDQELTYILGQFWTDLKT